MPIAEVMLWDWVTFGNLSINYNIILCDNNLLLNFNNGIWYLQDYIIKLNILILDSIKNFEVTDGIAVVDAYVVKQTIIYWRE